MIERDKEYYNQKISELYSVIENQEKIIRDLQEKINVYENPEDMTLFYMWLDTKAKDKLKQYKSVIDEAKEYILDKCPHDWLFRSEHIDKIFEILDKVKGSDK